jgi:predicted nucleic acid-binding protein
MVAILDRRDPDHDRCVAAMRDKQHEILVSTWACFTESMHLLGRTGGFSYQQALWTMYYTSGMQLRDLTLPEIERSRQFMEKYADSPMDLADATLLSLAESLKIGTVFTLDQAFRFYTLADGRVLDIIPGPSKP